MNTTFSIFYNINTKIFNMYGFLRINGWSSYIGRQQTCDWVLPIKAFFKGLAAFSSEIKSASSDIHKSLDIIEHGNKNMRDALKYESEN